MESVEKYQQQLLQQAQYIYKQTPISEATQKAYIETPRHKFVRRYREWASKEWREVNADNLQEHLATLYADRALILFGEDEDVSSTISQPTFVLRMLDMLQLEPGQRVFELGTGSGWNAALMGHLVGSQGCVYSLEIIPQVAQAAAEIIEALGIQNVKVIEADGGEGYAAAAPYDRAIFTAGTYDLPHHFFEQMKEDGLLLIVIKNEGGGDSLFLLRKSKEHFESIASLPCGFVQMKGRYQLGSLEPIQLEKLPEWSELRQKAVGSRPFWWAGKGNQDFLWRTLGVRSFLSIIEPTFLAFKTESGNKQVRDELFFGLWDQEHRSLVLARDDLLLSYGSSIAEECLVSDLERWVRLGMPSATSFDLQVFPGDFPLTAGESQWIVKRPESQFLWSLRGKQAVSSVQ